MALSPSEVSEIDRQCKSMERMLISGGYPEHEAAAILDQARSYAVKSIEVRRGKTKPLCSLLELALQNLVVKGSWKIYQKYAGQDFNPFDVLSNNIIQLVFGRIVEKRFTKEFCLVSRDLALPFYLLLLNSNVSQVYLTLLDTQSKNENRILLEHVFQKCPSIKVLNAQSSLVQDGYVEVPSCKIVSKWPKLIVLNMMGYFLTDEHAKIIQEGLPQLQEMSVNLSSLLFTKEGVDFVSKIQKLVVLAVKVVQERSLDFRNIIVQLAGRCPALKSFHLKHVHGQLWFVPMYGRLFPEKAQLVLCTLDVTKSLEFKWPENLVVAKLKIKAKVNDKTILKLSKLKPVVMKLVIRSEISAKNLYVLMEGIGAGLLSLDIRNWDERPLTLDEAASLAIDTHAVLLPCRSLQHLKWATGVALGKFAHSPDLKPEYFKNLQSFEFQSPFPYTLELASYFLMGSDKFKTYEGPFDVIKCAVLHIESSLTKIEHLKLLCQDQSELGEACGAVYTLLMRRNSLKKITVDASLFAKLEESGLLEAAEQQFVKVVTSSTCCGHFLRGADVDRIEDD